MRIKTHNSPKPVLCLIENQRLGHLSPDHKLSMLDRITGTATGNANSHQNSHQPKTATRSERAEVA